MVVLLQICCILSEHLFLRTTREPYFCFQYFVSQEAAYWRALKQMGPYLRLDILKKRGSYFLFCHYYEYKFLYYKIINSLQMDLLLERFQNLPLISFQLKIELYDCKVLVICQVIRDIIACKSQKQSPEVFYEKDVVKNSKKLTGKHVYQSLFFDKVSGIRPLACNFIKKETLAQVLSCEFCKILEHLFLQNISGRLLLKGDSQ